MNIWFLKKENVFIAFFVLLMLVMAVSNLLLYPLLLLISALFIYINYNSVHSDTIMIPKIMLTLLLFQNFSIGIGAHLAGNFNGNLSIITQVPTIFIVISYFFLLFSNRIKKREFLFFLYTGVCLLFFFVGTGILTAKVMYLRNFLIFYMAFSAGKYYLNTKDKMNEFIQYFLLLSVIAAIFGMIGVVLGKTFYQTIGVLEVYKAKRYTAYRNGLPGNFRTVFFGVWVNRFASLYYDPVNFSYYMALSCLVAYVTKKKFLFVCFLICEILTFGKGGLLILGLTLSCITAQKLFHRYSAKIIRRTIFLFAVLGIIALVYVIQTKFAEDFGTYNHFYGMATGMNAVIENPFGHGLGTAGNLIKTAQSNSQEISETGLINMAYQIGVIGTLLFCYLFLSTAKGSFLQYRRTKTTLYLMCSFLPFVLLIVSLYQENTYTPQCIVPYMLFIGGAWNNRFSKHQGGEDTKWNSK